MIRCVARGETVALHLKCAPLYFESGTLELDSERPTGSPLDYWGPAVKVPDPEVDPLDQHGSPVGHGEPGASRPYTLDYVALGAFYTERTYTHMHNTGTTDNSLADADLRARLIELGVPPERIEEEFQRVMDVVFSTGNDK